MNPLIKECRYTRAHSVLWRDTGLHVVALGPRDDAEVAVLGGGSAVLWRLLDEPLGLDEIGGGGGGGGGPPAPRGRAARGGGPHAAGAAPDDPDEVAVCLDDLVERGLVSWMIEEDEL